MIGGAGERKTLRMVAQYADESNLICPVEEIPRKLEVLADHCADAWSRPRGDHRLLPDQCLHRPDPRAGGRRVRGLPRPPTAGRRPSRRRHRRHPGRGGESDTNNSVTPASTESPSTPPPTDTSRGASRCSARRWHPCSRSDDRPGLPRVSAAARRPRLAGPRDCRYRRQHLLPRARTVDAGRPRRTPAMKLALYLPNFRDKVTVKELEDLTALAEDLDFDSVWTLDRIVVPEASDRAELQYPFGMMTEFPLGMPVISRGEWFQGMTLIPWLAAKTHKIRIGMSIIDTPYRAPGCAGRRTRHPGPPVQRSTERGRRFRLDARGVRRRERHRRVPPPSRARPRDDRDHARHLDQRPVRIPRRVRRLRAMRVRSQAAAEATPADLLQRAERPEALRAAHRQVRTLRLDRDPGLSGGDHPLAHRDRAGTRARSAARCPTPSTCAA